MNEIKNVESTPAAYDKIGGWLILVAIGLILTPLRLGFALFKDILPVFSAETWQVLTTPGTEAYHPSWAPLLIFELVGNIIFIIFPIVIAIFFFQKRKVVPKLIIAFLLSNLAFVGSDYFLANTIPFVASQDDPASLKELARTLVGSLIWVPYFLVSKRAKATFIK